MAVYSIGDLHLDSTGDKPMDIFGDNWAMHQEKIFHHWNEQVKEDDLVLIPGDISWALRLEEAYYDLVKIDRLPGNKIMSKGNHDYWWETKAKLESLNLNTIKFINNNSFVYQNIGVYGTRGWSPEDSDEFNKHDKKIFSREVNRLELSLSSLKERVEKKIVLLHYPPFNMGNKSPNEFAEVMKDHNVSICLYGHLHSEGHKFIVEGNIDGIEYYCVSSDYIDFKLKRICD